MEIKGDWEKRRWWRDEGKGRDERERGEVRRSSGGWSVRWMRCHLTGPAGRLPAPQRCKLVNMEANYCCPCDQGIIQPYHNTHARTCTRTHAICVDQQRTPTPSDPVASLRTLLLNLLNRRPATPTLRNLLSIPELGHGKDQEEVKKSFCTQITWTNISVQVAILCVDILHRSNPGKKHLATRQGPETYLALTLISTSVFLGAVFCTPGSLSLPLLPSNLLSPLSPPPYFLLPPPTSFSLGRTSSSSTLSV